MDLIKQYPPLSGKQFQVLNEKGSIVNKKWMPTLPATQLLNMHRMMVLTRIADDKALKLQRSGRMGTFAQVLGQEAQVGVGFAMKQTDWLFPSFRETGVMLSLGMPLENFYLLFMGSELGNKMPPTVNSFPVAVPVGTQTLHAVGAAWAAKIKGDTIATVTFFGDGATSEGDFHEAMNFAGVFKTPTVFVCQNNQYAISVPRSQQTASKTLAQKAYAYGFDGIQVDGNDILALYAATKAALAKAYAGNGPTFIEAYTYRLAPHTTSDDPTIYRTDQEVKAWQMKDPIKRFRTYLLKKKILTVSQESKMIASAEQQVAAAVDKAEKLRIAQPEDIFNFMYKDMTPRLKEQLTYLKDITKKRGAAHA